MGDAIIESREPSLEQGFADELKEALEKSEAMEGVDGDKKRWLNREISRIILDDKYQPFGVSAPDRKKIFSDLFTLTEEAEHIVTYQKYKETLQTIISNLKT